MSSPLDPADDAQRPLPPRVVPVQFFPASPPRSAGSSIGWTLLILLLLASLALNAVLLCGGFLFRGLMGNSAGAPGLSERFVAGAESASNKIAIVRIDGAILESQLGFAHRQIDEAGRDAAVRAVVVRIDSPGGTISASDDLHRRLIQLRDGKLPNVPQRSAKKPLVVSMGSVAASGGYYIAMPAYEALDPAAKKIYAERTTITGSIGVYAAFPNVEELAKKYGVSLDMIKAGAVKGSGSIFHRMTPQERQPWADMIDQAYAQFLGIVEGGRPQLAGKLTENLFAPKTIAIYDDRGNPMLDDAGRPKTTTYTRQRADGGIFTADEALQWGLIDAIGTLDDAIVEAARQAQLSAYRAIQYDRPPTLMSLITGTSTAAAPELGQWSANRGPRLWYLTPGAELTALTQALGRE